jgi:hypothetical protein
MESWQLDCPEGTWIGRLDGKEWGKSSNLKLYFTDEATGERYWFSVWFNNSYAPRGGGINFKHDGEPGDLFELGTAKNSKGAPCLISARKITAASA